MWTAEHRKTYVRGTTSYPSNLTDEEWAVLEPLIPSA
ncbi:MAG: IS5/IS1182 family transposase, partial [Bosea sp. (in: a-proteobacteria)]